MMLALALTHLVDVASVVFPCFPQIAVGADFEEFPLHPKHSQGRCGSFEAQDFASHDCNCFWIFLDAVES